MAQVRAAGPEELAALLLRLELDRSRTLRAQGPALEAARRRAAELERPDLDVRAELADCDRRAAEGDVAGAATRVLQLNAWALEQAQPLVLARSHALLSLFAASDGDMADARWHALQGVEALPDDCPPGLRVQHLIAATAVMDGLADMQPVYEEILRITADTGDVAQEMAALNNMAYDAVEAGDVALAARTARRLRARSISTGLPLRAGQLDTLACIEEAQGLLDAAEATARAAVEIARSEPSQPHQLPECLLTLARVLDGRGDELGTLEVLEETGKLCEVSGMDLMLAAVLELRAKVHARAGRWREAYQEHVSFHRTTEALWSAEREERAQRAQARFDAERARRDRDHYRDLALHDPLTGLGNRRYAEARLGDLLTSFAAGGDTLAVGLLDVDHFKRINDTLSHDVGDQVLTALGGILRRELTGGAFAARLGGEEFLMVWPDTEGDAAVRLADALRRCVETHEWSEVVEGLRVTASIGVASPSAECLTYRQVIALADRHLYAAKDAGRNRVVAG
ncbi:GGDEF domain-containing protein [Kineococcus sp. NUM-3379]